MAETKRTILVVDDDVSQRRLLGDFVAALDFRAAEAGSAEEALEFIRRTPPDMVLLDVRLPGMDGVTALGEIRKIAGALPVLLITAHGELRQAVEAIKSGADDYLLKPLDLDELEAAIVDAIGASGVRPAKDRALPDLPKEFICHSAAMRHVLETALVVAPSTAPVLILGPSGVGKEVVAELIHRWSPRRRARWSWPTAPACPSR